MAHAREGRIKAADSGSLEFAYLLAKFTDSSFFCVTRADLPDSNHHEGTALKERVAERAQSRPFSLALDLHACHAVRPYDLEIGSLCGASLLGRPELQSDLMEGVAAKGFFCVENQVFKGAGAPGAQTMAPFFSESLRVPSMQLEINSALINDDGALLALHQKTKLLHCFCEFLKKAQP